MSNNVKIELNSQGVAELLKSPEMRGIIQELSDDCLARCGAGYKADVRTGSKRVFGTVITDSTDARIDNSKNNTLLKSMKG